MAWPPAVADFKDQFRREFDYGDGKEKTQDHDIQRGMNDALSLFKPTGWDSDAEKQSAFFYLAAHCMVLNVQDAGGLSLIDQSMGMQNSGRGTIASKGVGPVNLQYAIPEKIQNSPILNQFMQTGFGMKYLEKIAAMTVGVLAVADGPAPTDVGVQE